MRKRVAGLDDDGGVCGVIQQLRKNEPQSTCRYLKDRNPEVQIVGLQPEDGASIPGIRRWPQEYLPRIFDERCIDRVMSISQQEAEETMRALARVEGVMAGVSSGGAVSAALRLSSEVWHSCGMKRS